MKQVSNTMRHETTGTVTGQRIVEMEAKHLDPILALMVEEGWYYYDERELARYLELGEVCKVLLDGDTVIGSIFTTNYGDQAWIGNIVVEKDERGRGHASRMIDSAVTELAEKGVGTFRLASVPDAIKVYQRPPHSFHAEFFTTAQQAELPVNMAGVPIELDGVIRPMISADLESVAALDARHFGSQRPGLLTRLYHDSVAGCCLCLEMNGKLEGFIMARRRKASKAEGGFREGPDHAYRIGPSCVSTGVGVRGFKALFERALACLNEDVRERDGEARAYIVYPRNARREEISTDLAGRGKDSDEVFATEGHVFDRGHSDKCQSQWEYLQELGFNEEYYELVMSHAVIGQGRGPAETLADPEGIFASATPGDKA